jgi:hypothetical protein
MGNSQNGARAMSDLAFTNLLASAYSLQLWQDQRKSAVSALNSDELVGIVLETQGLVWRHAVHPDTAMQLIATRSQKLCGAAGAAIAFLEGQSLAYAVTTGIATRMLGCKILADSSFSFWQLRSLAISESDTWSDKALGAYVMTASVLSVPIHRNGKLAGCFQLFSRLGHFNEQSKSTCELMSAILGQLIEEAELLVHETMTCASENREPHMPERVSGMVANSGELHCRPEQVSGVSNSPSPSRWRKLLSPLRNRSNRKLFPESHALDVGHDLGNFDDDGDKRHGQQERTGGTSEPATRKPKPGGRILTMLYPVSVLVFVAVTNIFGRGYPWFLYSGTLIIVIFTAVELSKLRSHPKG